MSEPNITHIRVFGISANEGGNPVPVLVDADNMSDTAKQTMARKYNRECVFVRPSADPCKAIFEFSYWVPNHEMEMCGHATIAAVSVLSSLNRICNDNVQISTKSGIVQARLLQVESGEGEGVQILQSLAEIQAVPSPGHTAICEILGITSDSIKGPIQNTRTARWKTLVPLKSRAILEDLRPNFDRVQKLCDSIGSTGLHPYAHDDERQNILHAR